jgi:uncharacterized integral membrane protein (TIGR00698 family)
MSSVVSATRAAGMAGARSLPGLALVVGLSVLAAGGEQVLRWLAGTPAPVIEALVIALLLGMLVRNLLGQPAAAGPGVALAGKQLLELAVMLLGLTMNLGQLAGAGLRLPALIVLCVLLALLVTTAVGRLLGLGARLAILVAVGNGICGNSAIAAAAPAIRADKKEVATAVALTAVVGVLLVLGLPWLVPLLHLTHAQYGVLVGTTVYAVPQVVAAAFPVSPAAGEVATAVKLLRVLLLGPVVLALSLLYRRGPAGAAPWRTVAGVPWYIAGFLVLLALSNLGVAPAAGAALGLPPAAPALAAKEVSRLLMIVAMAALGLGVEVAAVRRVGPRVLATVVISTACLVLTSLGLIVALGIGRP